MRVGGVFRNGSGLRMGGAVRTQRKMTGEAETSGRAERPIARLPYLAAAIPLLLLEYAAAFLPVSARVRSREGGPPRSGGWRGSAGSRAACWDW